MLDKAKFLLSKSKMLEQYNKILEMCDVLSYSSKTNYTVAELLEELTDCFFSVHSVESLETVKDKKRIWYFAQAWDDKELSIIFDKDVKNVVVDNEADLQKLLDFLDKKCKTVNLLLRMRLKEHTIHTGKYFVYGMYSRQINSLVPMLKKNPNIGKLGVHFHRKSQNISEWSLKYELKDLLSGETLASIDYVNMGGGIPVRYKNFRANVVKNIFDEIKTLKEWLNNHNIKLIVEPGRFIAAPCIKLVAKIKSIYDGNIIINCSVFNTALDTFVVHHKLMVEGELEKGELYTIKGQTPDSMDIFRYRVALNEPKIGDTITFLHAGAYNYASDFCRLPKLETEVVE